jgi:hypothetical protein
MMAFNGVMQEEWYSTAARHLLAAPIALWLMGMGGMALETIVDERLRLGTRNVALAGWMTLLIGVLATGGIFLAAIADKSTVQGLFVGAGLEMLGLVLGLAALLRAARGVR